MQMLWMHLLLLIVCLNAVHGYTNPVIDSDNPDPGVLYIPEADLYLAVTTHGEEGASFPLLTSADLVTWEHQGWVFPAGSRPEYCASSMWAPEIHNVNGRYLAYFSCAAPNGRHSVGVAVSESGSPLGPYVDPLGVPLIYHNEDSVVGCLDQTYFKDPETGRDYIIWKTDDILPVIRTGVIYIQEIEQGGTAFAEESEKSAMIWVDRPDEYFVVEGPWLMYREGIYYLFYSANSYKGPNYRMNVATSTNVTGPYEKYEIPVVQTDWDRYNQGLNSTFEGPGHGSVVVDRAGAWWLVYHSWRYGREGGRRMLLDRLEWHGLPGLVTYPRVEGAVPSDQEREDPI